MINQNIYSASGKHSQHSTFSTISYVTALFWNSPVKCCNVSYHNYADDTQIYVSLTAGEHGPIDTLCHCIEQISVWMQNNFLQLNLEKTEIIVCGPQKQRESLISHLETLSLKPNNQVGNLGVILDSDLNFNSHIKSITSEAFYHLKNIARIKWILKT